MRLRSRMLPGMIPLLLCLFTGSVVMAADIDPALNDLLRPKEVVYELNKVPKGIFVNAFMIKSRNNKIRQRRLFSGRPLERLSLEKASLILLDFPPDDALRSRLEEEPRAGSRIISRGVALGLWEPDGIYEGKDGLLFSWKVPARIEGIWRMTIQREENEFPMVLWLCQKFQKAGGMISGPDGRLMVEQAVIEGTRVRFAATSPNEEGFIVRWFEGFIHQGSISGQVSSAAGVDSWVAGRIN